MRLFTLLILALFASGAALRADLIVLKDGKEYEGKLLKATPEQIFFRQGDKEEAYPRETVVHVRLQSPREWDACSRIDQVPDPVLQQVWAEKVDPTRYPGAAAVILYEAHVIQLQTPQTWEQADRFIVRQLKEDGERVSIQQVEYRKDADSCEIVHGACIRPDGTLLSLKDTAVQEESVFPDLPRCDTMSRRRFALPEGKAGNTFDTAIRTTRTKPLPDMFFYGEFLFGGGDPVRECRIEFFAPNGVTLHAQVLNDPANAVQATREKTAAGEWFRWVRRDAPQLMPEPMMPPDADCSPRLVVSSRPDTWAELARQQQEYLDQLDRTFPNLSPPPARDAVALWEYVSRNVEETSASPTASDFRPGDPADVLRLRRAPAVDRTYLLYRWLRAAGCGEVRWVWLRTRQQGELAAEVPDVQAFSNPAVRVVQAGQTRYLIPGGDLDAVTDPAMREVGSRCLVTGDGLATVTAAGAELPGLDQEITVALNRTGDGQVRHTIHYRGEDAHSLRGWRRLTQDQIRNAVEGQVHRVDARAGNIRYQVIGDYTRNDVPLSVVLEYDIPALADCRDNVASARLPWLRFDASIVGRTRRTLPLFWDMPREDAVTIVVTAPANLTLHAGGETVTMPGAVAELTTTAPATAGQARYDIRYRRAVTSAPASDYPALKNCLEKRAGLARQYWIWRKAK